jgi:hypothetical protein
MGLPADGVFNKTSKQTNRGLVITITLEYKYNCK